MLNEFIEYLEQEVANHSIYVIGAQGQRGSQITEKWIRSRETDEKNANRAVAHWKKECAAGYGEVLGAFDCSGLGMYWLQNLQRIYPGDMNANGMMSKCTRLAKDDLKRGDWVFITNDAGRATHIGYVADQNLNVIEARGRDYGVVKGALDGRWNAFGRPDVFAAEIEGGGNITIYRTLKKGDVGDDVKAMQQALLDQGYSLGGNPATGKFASATEKAVRQFQKDHGLTVDGVAGKNTITALGLTWGDPEPDYKSLYEQEKKRANLAEAELLNLQKAYEDLLLDLRKIKVIAEKY